MRFFTADHHFGHANIIGYAGRPFDDVDKMADFFVRTWNEEVSDEDEVWVLGDVALGKLPDSLSLIELLQGRKVLVPGNHDRCWQGHKKFEKARQQYLDAGFAEIVDNPDPIMVAGERVLLSHFPYRGSGDHGSVERYPEWRPTDHGNWLLHGHVHEKWRIRGRQINVGVDAWGAHLLSLEQVERYVTAPRPYDRKPYKWSWAANLTEAEIQAIGNRLGDAIQEMGPDLFEQRYGR